MQLSGARALVTGASGGIGAAVADSLARAGADLLLTGRDVERLATVRGHTGGAVLPADLLRAADRDALVGAVRDDGLELLVLGAGLGGHGPLADHDDAAIDTLVATNLTAQIRLVRALLPVLQTGRGPSRIVVVGSIAGVLGVPQESVYAATKAGLMAFADSLRGELRDRGVGVLVLVPGVVDTGFYAHRGAAYARSFPRPLPPQRVARALIRGMRRDAEEVVVPGWLRVPMVIRAVAPQTYRRAAARWG